MFCSKLLSDPFRIFCNGFTGGLRAQMYGEGGRGAGEGMYTASYGKSIKMWGPQHVDKNGIHNILTDARVLVFGIYVSILLLPCLWAGCLGLDVEK